MATVRSLVDINMRPIEAFHLGIDGLMARYGGWVPASVINTDNTVISLKDSAVYASASTFTVPADITSLVQKGDKIKWTQSSTVKYGYILSASYSAPNTTITIAVNTDYTVANETITEFWISRVSLPLGFPRRFNWSATLTGFSANPTNAIYQYYVQNQTCICDVRQATAGTSNATDFTITAPITAATVTNGVWGVMCFQAFNNGAEISPPARVFIGSAGTTFTLNLNSASGLWTNANGKMASFTAMSYPI